MKKIARVLLNRDMLMLYIVNFLLADTAIFVFFLVGSRIFRKIQLFNLSSNNNGWKIIYITKFL